MNPILDYALQWVGFTLIVAGYWRFAKSKTQGASCALAGCFPLAVWAIFVGAWGVLALEVACILMNAKTLYDEWKLYVTERDKGR